MMFLGLSFVQLFFGATTLFNIITNNAVSATSAVVEGLYSLSSITYTDSTTVPIPGEYFSTLSFIGDDAYSFDMHIMNRMFTTMTVLSPAQVVQQEDDNTSITNASATKTPVSISSIGSTRMMPPAEIDAVEMGLRTILPETTDMIIQQQLKDNDNSTLLTFDGTAGSVVFQWEGLLPVE
jgi:hypothetical protein